MSMTSKNVFLMLIYHHLLNFYNEIGHNQFVFMYLSSIICYAFSPKLNSAGSLVLTTNRSSPNSITGFITMCKYVVFETFKISKI